MATIRDILFVKFAGLFFVGLGLALSIITVRHFGPILTLWVSGHEVNGTIVDIVQKEKNEDGIFYYPVYEYTDQYGDTYSLGPDNVVGSTSETFRQVGQQATIAYNEDHPSSATEKTGSGLLTAIIAIALPIIGIFVGLLILISRPE